MKPTRSDHLSDADLALRGLSRETDIVLDPTGRFSAGGQPLQHPGVVAAFSRWIERTPAGRYVLRNDLHYVYLEVQGAPLHARAVEAGPDGRPRLRLQGGEVEPLRPGSLRSDREGVLYADGRDGTWPVRLAPPAVLGLAPWLEEDDEGEVALVVDGERFAVSEVEDPFTPRAGSLP